MEAEYLHLVDQLRDFQMCPNARAQILGRLVDLNNRLRAKIMPRPRYPRKGSQIFPGRGLPYSGVGNDPNRSKKGVLIHKSSVRDGSNRSPQTHTSVIHLGDRADPGFGNWHHLSQENDLVQKLVKIARLWDRLKMIAP